MKGEIRNSNIEIRNKFKMGKAEILKMKNWISAPFAALRAGLRGNDTD